MKEPDLEQDILSADMFYICSDSFMCSLIDFEIHFIFTKSVFRVTELAKKVDKDPLLQEKKFAYVFYHAHT